MNQIYYNQLYYCPKKHKKITQSSLEAILIAKLLVEFLRALIRVNCHKIEAGGVYFLVKSKNLFCIVL
jgi:hypothetical protein